MSAARSGLRTRALSSIQERKLVEYIDNKLLDLTRNFKKRSHPSTSLPTLETYLDAVHPILAVILQIPPTKPPQASLRIALLLRLTGEVLISVPGYAPTPEPLPSLLSTLDILDRGWLAVLLAQVWDAGAHEGVDLNVATDPGPNPSAGTTVSVTDGQGAEDMDPSSSPKLVLQALLRAGGEGGVLMSQTERTRLRSLLMSGTTSLEEWLEGLHVSRLRDSGVIYNANGDMKTVDAETPLPPVNGLSDTLEFLGLQQSFDDLFERTLSEMGDLHGDELWMGEVETS